MTTSPPERRLAVTEPCTSASGVGAVTSGGVPQLVLRHAQRLRRGLEVDPAAAAVPVVAPGAAPPAPEGSVPFL